MNNGKTVWSNWMSYGTGVDEWWRCFQMFLESVPKFPSRFTYIFLRTVDVWSLVLVNNTTFLKFAVFVLWWYEKWLDGVGSFEMSLYALFVVCPFELFSQANPYGTTMEMFLCLLWSLVPLVLCLVVTFGLRSLLLLCLYSELCCSLFRAQVVKRQDCNALLMLSSSLDKAVGLLETTLACVLKCCMHYV